ncbi:MAG: hypothetical protein M1833_002641 [Piccolia ochrophora]|nr:MAG: hypothetical protein M1833_002641 [Piccolia ochrophora]
MPEPTDPSSPTQSNVPSEAPTTSISDQSAIEIDRDSENDSAYGDDLSTFTASLTSTVFDYQYENGRRYHAYQEGKYIMPNDEQESDRLDMAHHMMVLRTDEKLHLAPIGKNPQTILDLGTGTGIWPIQMGDKYPSAQILGNDLSPEQPTIVPPNVKFEVDDIESEWTYPTPFDYIHVRYLATAIADWPTLVKRCFQNVAPGGWVEFQDYDMQYYSEDGSLKPDAPTAKWIGLSIKAAYDNGRDPSPGPKLEGWGDGRRTSNWCVSCTLLLYGQTHMTKAIQPQKTVGAWNLLQILEGLEGFSLALFTRTLGWSLEEVQVLLAQVRKDLRDPAIHMQLDFHVVYARKPTEDE